MSGTMPTLLHFYEPPQGFGIPRGLILDGTPGAPRRAVTSQLEGVSKREGEEICRRWNAHEELVHTLREIVRAAREHPNVGWGVGTRIDHAEALLARIEAP